MPDALSIVITAASRHARRSKNSKAEETNGQFAALLRKIKWPASATGLGIEDRSSV
jgi:hypothetical protein